jgi:hypothetical protein
MANDLVLEAVKLTGVVQPSGQSKKCPKLCVGHQLKHLQPSKKLLLEVLN